MLHFDEDVGIAEHLFDRKIKCNRENPAGHMIWIFGTLHGRTNTLFLYLVDNRAAKPLIHLIRKHCSVNKNCFGQLGRLLRIKIFEIRTLFCD